jgi:diguanylate cyclase (GGDEF)-like protein
MQMISAEPKHSHTAISMTDMAGMESSPSIEPATADQRRRATLICIIIAFTTLALAPIAGSRWPHIPAFLPVYQTVLITAYLIIACLIFGLYRANQSLAPLYLCAGCIYTSVVLIVQFLSFSNMFTAKDALLGGPQTTIWLWCFWHAGPPTAIFLYALSEWRRPGFIVAHPERTAYRFGAVLVLVLGASIAAATVFRDWMPVLDINGDFRKITTTGIAPAIQAMTAAALVLLWRATRFRTSLNVWLGVALIALLFDNAITMIGGSRLSIGWYTGRLNALVSAVVMLLGYLREINYAYLKTVNDARRLAASNALLEVKADQARLDSLTGLPGRALFLEQAGMLHARSIDNATAGAVLFIDLDGLKAVNDHRGHGHGDAVLKKTAEALRSVLRDIDVAGRVGGDEFVVYLVAPVTVIHATATGIAGRIVAKVAEIGNGLGCSVGISLCNADCLELESALWEADQAMYQAKKNGKNRFIVYSPKPSERFSNYTRGPLLMQ